MVLLYAPSHRQDSTYHGLCYTSRGALAGTRLHGVGHMVKDNSDTREETRCRHMGYSFRLTAGILLYAPSHREGNTYHVLCYTSHGTLARKRNSSKGPLHEGSIRRPIAPWANALATELHLAPSSHRLSERGS